LGKNEGKTIVEWLMSSELPPKHRAHLVRLANCAPDLLAALKEMVEQYGAMVDGGVEEPARLAVEHAKTEIAKAER